MKKLIAFKIFLTSFNLFSSITKEQSIILTSYTYPGSLYWEKVIEMGEDKILYVIINPSSGPGEIRDENYVKQIEKIKKSNIKIIAYIPTNYQKRSINTVYKDIEKYFEFYGKENLNGFFFDEIGVENKNEVEYLKEYKSLLDVVFENKRYFDVGYINSLLENYIHTLLALSAIEEYKKIYEENKELLSVRFYLQYCEVTNIAFEHKKVQAYIKKDFNINDLVIYVSFVNNKNIEEHSNTTIYFHFDV